MKRIETPEDVSEYINSVKDVKRIIDRYNRNSIKYMTDFALMIDHVDLGTLTSFANELYKSKYGYLKSYVKTTVLMKEKERTKG